MDPEAGKQTDDEALEEALAELGALDEGVDEASVDEAGVDEASALVGMLIKTSVAGLPSVQTVPILVVNGTEPEYCVVVNK